MRGTTRLAFLFAFACAAFCQSAPPAFEVASVKPADPNGHPGVGIDLRTFPGGKLLATDCTLKQLIQAAYSVEPWQVLAGPAWLDSDRFDIEAKAGQDFSKDPDRVAALGHDAPRKMMTMLQTLLAERFSVKVHREIREDNIYSLAVARNGPKLHPPTGTDPPFIGLRRTGAIERPAVTLILAGENATMELLAQRLSYWTLHRPVLDKTSIKGNYSVRIEYAADDSQPDGGPSLFTAIQDQIGLKLESAKGPVEFLIVDHADKPSAN
jgi:uncharacterized protein (TIGR03435 family)